MTEKTNDFAHTLQTPFAEKLRTEISDSEFS